MIMMMTVIKIMHATSCGIDCDSEDDAKGRDHTLPVASDADISLYTQLLTVGPKIVTVVRKRFVHSHS
jgi:hypothetical protein